MKRIIFGLITFLTIDTAISQQFNWIACGEGDFNEKYQAELNGNIVFKQRNKNTNSDEIYQSNGLPNGKSLLINLQAGNIIGINSNSYSSSLPSYFVKNGNKLFFKVGGGVGGSLWSTDGTSNGTIKIKDLPNYFISNLCQMNGEMYFITGHFDQVWGNQTHELWRSDGTTNGTYVIKDWLNSTQLTSNDLEISSFKNKIYFSGFESDGSSLGTVYTGFNLPKSYSQNYIVEPPVIYNGLMYFSRYGQIWKSDGSASGTVLAVDFPIRSNLFEHNGWLYFQGGYSGAGKMGYELCKTDGTLSNTTVVKDIFLGYQSSEPSDFKSANGLLFFIANDGIHGREFWRSDGTANGTIMIKDLTAGSLGTFSGPNFSGYYPRQDFFQTVLNNQIYFRANQGIWKTDGYAVNTYLVHATDSIRLMQTINSKLFFSVDSTCSDLNYSGWYSNVELWCMNGNGTPAYVNEINKFNSIKLSPNPTNDKISIKIEEIFINEKYFLFDQYGRLILSSKFESIENEVDLSQFKSGIYFLIVEGSNETTKIVKN